jgi:hypothetical protein
MTEPHPRQVTPWEAARDLLDEDRKLWREDVLPESKSSRAVVLIAAITALDRVPVELRDAGLRMPAGFANWSEKLHHAKAVGQVLLGHLGEEMTAALVNDSRSFPRTGTTIDFAKDVLRLGPDARRAARSNDSVRSNNSVRSSNSRLQGGTPRGPDRSHGSSASHGRTTSREAARDNRSPTQESPDRLVAAWLASGAANPKHGARPLLDRFGPGVRTAVHAVASAMRSSVPFTSKQGPGRSQPPLSPGGQRLGTSSTSSVSTNHR